MCYIKFWQMHIFRPCAQEAEGAGASMEGTRLRDVVARCGALASARPRASFGTASLEQDLARLLRSGNPEQHRDVLDRPLAAGALAGCDPHVHSTHWSSKLKLHAHQDPCGRGAGWDGLVGLAGWVPLMLLWEVMHVHVPSLSLQPRAALNPDP